MENIKLNETPIRTVKSFNINNIEIQNIKIPKRNQFNNIEIIAENVMMDDNIKAKPLTYGNGKILEDSVLKNANHKLRIQQNEEKSRVEVIYKFDDDNLNLINNIEVYAKNEIDIIIKYISNTNKKCFHNGIIKILGTKNSKVNVTIINLLNLYSDNFESMENELEDFTNLKYTIIDFGSKNSVTNYYSNIIGKEAKNELKTIYLGVENQLKDLNYIAHLKEEKSEIDIDVQGALKDEAKKHFKGTIDFKKGCKKSKGSESEYCMLLSDKAKSIALPILLCTEENVEGEHSAASGKLDEEKLFYIMSRGISRKEATKLIVKANFNKIIEKINNEQLQKQVLKEIDSRLG